MWYGSAMENLPPTLQKYVDFIASAGRPVTFTEITSVMPNVNMFRFLKSRGLIHNVIKDYSDPNEPYTGPRIPMYVLTERGQKYAPTEE